MTGNFFMDPSLHLFLDYTTVTYLETVVCTSGNVIQKEQGKTTKQNQKHETLSQKAQERLFLNPLSWVPGGWPGLRGCVTGCVSGVTRYLEFKSIEGSYVMGRSGKISKVKLYSQDPLFSFLHSCFLCHILVDYIREMYLVNFSPQGFLSYITGDDTPSYTLGKAKD